MDRFRLSGLLMTSLVHGAVVVSLVAFSECTHSDNRPKIGEMVTIEASLAYKSGGKKTTQPQKRPRRPAPTPTPETNPVSRDEDQTPVEPKPDQPKPPDEEEDFSKQFEKFRDERQQDEEETGEEAGAGGEPGRAGGAFDGSDHGFAEVNKGDPYLRELAAQAHRFWTVPTLEQGSGQAVGCVRLGENGRILDSELGRDLDLPGAKPPQNATIDAAVKRALKELTELREREAQPVPAHLKEATTQWICFNFPY
jgi:hypothetical protein